MPRNKTKETGHLGLLALLALGLALLTGCGATGSSDAAASAATPTPLPTAIIPEKPTYRVEAGTVVLTLSFTGRASPVLEQELFFETGGSVSEVYVARGDWVQAGDLLAELEVSNLEKQLAQKKVNLETSRLRLEQAQLQAAEAITTTLAKLGRGQEEPGRRP
jgi:membrane fusion protein, macrolide-specific efflux system